jgi:uncharacterized protein with NRDE domain
VCTVSLLRAPWTDDEPDDGLPAFRLVANRDEQRSRPGALPPRRTRHEGLDVLAPVDPLGGGTWIAASSAGLVFVLLNEYRPAAAGRAGLRSRGLVIPTLVASASLAVAQERASRLDPESFLPFRLLVVDRHRLIEIVADGQTLAFCHDDASSRRVLRTSSLVDQQRARACRTALFGQIVAAPSRRAQDAFHRAAWPDNEALGVRMSREDACTVSVTTVDVCDARIAMTYCARLQAGQEAVTDHLQVHSPLC